MAAASAEHLRNPGDRHVVDLRIRWPRYHGVIVDKAGNIIFSTSSRKEETTADEIAENWREGTYYGLGDTAIEALERAILYVEEAA